MKLDALKEIVPSWFEAASLKTSEYEGMETSVASVEIHNASWCPDCERETTEALSFIMAHNLENSVEVFNYENKEDYKAKKLTGELPIKCLPTIKFFSSTGELLYSLEEQAEPDFKSVILAV